MDLHVNGADVATGTHLTPWNAMGSFRIGALKVSPTAIGGYFNGQVAEVLAFNQVVIYDGGNPAIWDFNADLRPDLIAAHTNGALHMYRGNGAGGFKAGYGAMIGSSSWNSYNIVLTSGDFNGDGYNDIIGVKPNGDLVFHRGNGVGGFIGKPTTAGTEFNSFNTIFSPGDFDGDRKPDIIGRKPTGELMLYKGNGTGGFLGQGTSIGTDFNTFNMVLGPGDFNGDAHPDVIARRPNGDPVLYRGNGVGGWISGSTGVKVGTGWDVFFSIF
jgi:FG-GAP-like repeat